MTDHVEIVSGEGERGTNVTYTGKLTVRAIKTRLTKEECHGDRWAYVRINGERKDIHDIAWLLESKQLS